MARRVPIAEARSNLTGLIREVETGKRVEFTRRGRRVAVVISCDEYDGLRSAHPDLGKALRAWRQSLLPDFEGFSRKEVDSWRERKGTAKPRFP